MIKTPIRLIVSGALLVGVPVYLTATYTPTETINGLIYGGVSWSVFNLVAYISDIMSDNSEIADYSEEVSDAYTHGYISGREETGKIARKREKVIREFYDEKISSVASKAKEVRNVTNHVTHNTYTTNNNINALPRLANDEIIETQLIKG